MNELIEVQDAVARVPRWKVVVQKLLQDGFTYGCSIDASTLENLLGYGKRSLEFQFSIYLIRRALEDHGLYLSGRGFHGEKYVAIQARDNHSQMANYITASRDCLKRAVNLGSSTDTNLLNDEEKQKHERILERAQNKLALMNRRKG